MDAEAERSFKEIRAILKEVAERQAAAEARAVLAEERADRADDRMDRIEERSARMEARFEKRMRGFEKLVKIGMRELAALRRNLNKHIEETRFNINALIDSQQRTEVSLRAFLDSRRGRNGRNGGKPR